MGKRLILTAGILGFLLGCGWLAWWIHTSGADEPVTEIRLQDEPARLAFLEARGFSECHCVAAEAIRLPLCVDKTYAAYAAIQNAQQLPLTSALGASAVRYTYTQNSPGQEFLYTELLLNENQVLIGAVQYDSTAPQEMQPLIRTCLHRECARIFEHNFDADKAKICRRAVARQEFLT